MVNNLFKFTGNPFVDNGTALITVMTEKETPEEVDSKELIKVAEEISLLYSEEKWKIL